MALSDFIQFSTDGISFADFSNVASMATIMALAEEMPDLITLLQQDFPMPAPILGGDEVVFHLATAAAACVRVGGIQSVQMFWSVPPPEATEGECAAWHNRRVARA